MTEDPTYDPFGPARAAGGYAGDFNGEVMPVLTRWRDIRAAARDWQRFSNDGPGRVPVPDETDIRSLRQLPIEIDPPAHGAYKELVKDWFRRPLEDAILAARIATIAHDRVRAALDAGPVEVVQGISLPIQSLALAALFGLPAEEGEVWTGWGLHAFKSKGKNDPDKAAMLMRRIESYVDASRDGRGQTFFDHLASVRLDGRPLTIAANLPSAITDTALKTTENIDNAQDVVGIPLNAAFKAVQQYYDGKGKPLPEVLIRFLPPTFEKAHLESVRYVVDDSTGNLAGLINSLQTQFGSAEGGNHAVTVGNLIIFDKEPSPGIADLFFWAHEIQHTVQYATKGMDTFAAEYVTDYKGLEEDANNVALKAVEDVKTLLLMASNG